MKRSLRLFAILGFATLASHAHAAGLALRWDRCYADGGLINKAFACDTDTGTETLVGSVFRTKDAPQRSGVEVLLTLATAGASLPAWWAFKNLATCRRNELSANSVIPPASVGCIDWGSGTAVAGLAAYTIGTSGPTTARILAATGVSQSNLANLTKGNEYFLITLLVTHVKTLGTGACLGCTMPACIVFTSAKLDISVPSAAEDQYFDYPINGTDSNYVTWQGGAGVGSSAGTGCPAATPTRSSTWSAVKTLYR